MLTDRISYLLEKYLEGDISAAEMQELRAHLEREKGQGELYEVMDGIIEESAPISEYRESEWEPLLHKILSHTRDGSMTAADAGQQVAAAGKGKVASLSTWRIMRKLAAAAVLILLAGGTWILVKTHRREGIAVLPKAASHIAQDIPPGGNKAILTLADSSTVDLDAVGNGMLGQQGNLQVVKRKDGQLAYQPAGHGTMGPVTYNILTTPRGGQYQLILPDGSKVWLNADSRLKYPTGFSGRERMVELRGEAYFEIAKNAAMPFRVSVPSRGGSEPIRVDVLGTHFNIKAYGDERAVSTTLLTGSVRVEQGRSSVVLQPGESASCKDAGGIVKADADIEEAVAWKNGLFKYNEATIDDVMRQLSRWYDLEVVYVNGVPKDLFHGEIYRNVSVSKVLKVLEASGVKFSVEDKKILVK